VRRLGIRHQTALPMRELSALALRAGPSGQSQLLAVGDEDFAVVSAELEDTGEPAGTRRHDLLLSLRDTRVDVGSGSGFEGLASDGTGTIVLLQEEQARLLVMAADLSRLLHVIRLAVPRDDPLLGTAWHREPNARGEGLLLLDRGHVLICKERADACLIEFGPPEDAPRGIAADTVLAPRKPFARPDAVESEFAPLAVWPLAEDTRNALPTINDLALGPDGRIYALSGHAQMIARFEPRLQPGERARATDSWRIGDGMPGGEDARPEGLVILPSGRPLVGIDSKRAGDNLVMLQRLIGHGASDAGANVSDVSANVIAPPGDGPG